MSNAPAGRLSPQVAVFGPPPTDLSICRAYVPPGRGWSSPVESTVISLAYPTLACWALLEAGLRVREAVQGKGRRNRDRGSRVLITISVGAAIGVASMATSVAPSLRMPVAVQVFGSS